MNTKPRRHWAKSAMLYVTFGIPLIYAAVAAVTGLWWYTSFEAHPTGGYWASGYGSSLIDHSQVVGESFRVAIYGSICPSLLLYLLTITVLGVIYFATKE